MAAVDLASVAAAWVACFPPGGLGVATDGAATPALALLCAHGHAELLASQAADILQRQLRDAHVARFWDALGALAREPLHSAGGAAHDANGAAEDAAVDGEATERLENALLQALQALSGAVAAQVVTRPWCSHWSPALSFLLAPTHLPAGCADLSAADTLRCVLSRAILRFSIRTAAMLLDPQGAAHCTAPAMPHTAIAYQTPDLSRAVL